MNGERKRKRQCNRHTETDKVKPQATARERANGADDAIE